ncbi:uncharacterized protein LOC118269564 [Spodoptera frugiperda]|uniref:Uncharacterized protein LOC118269564 n=1 Tax=Spodoptera frugiperda TaxID=7108 RepID=A0A9R0F7F8_SPOFR|nr:uncharacterized protein LOC118269564 [Spodoptera frugiperda]XP_050562686.1 uncharacterized protein LOC118269564 [Spodoptera frugiperda]
MLKAWVLAIVKKGFPVNKKVIADSVNKIVCEDNRTNPFKNNTPGKAWFSSFLKRHPEIAAYLTKSGHILKTRVRESALRWHTDLKEYLIAEGVAYILEDPERIINAYESIFQTNSYSEVILGSQRLNRYYKGTDEEKENLTVLGTFTASGTILPPLIVYPRSRMPYEIDRQINQEWGIGESETGRMTSKNVSDYIANTLIPKLKENGTKFPVLLLVDGHKSFLNQGVSQVCEDNGIILYSFCPNSTHIQPVYVSVFRPLGDSWESVVKDWKLKTGYQFVTKAVFAIFLEATFNGVSKEVICNGFRKCGLYPFDANVISRE